MPLYEVGRAVSGLPSGHQVRSRARQSHRLAQHRELHRREPAVPDYAVLSGRIDETGTGRERSCVLDEGDRRSAVVEVVALVIIEARAACGRGDEVEHNALTLTTLG